MVQTQPVSMATEERPDLEAFGMCQLGYLLEQPLDALETALSAQTGWRR